MFQCVSSVVFTSLRFHDLLLVMWGGFQSKGSSAGHRSETDNWFSMPKSMNQGIVSSGFCLQGVNGMSCNGLDFSSGN